MSEKSRKPDFLNCTKGIFLMKKDTSKDITGRNEIAGGKKSRREQALEASLAKLRARDEKLRTVRIVLRIALVLATVIFVFSDIAAALGIIASAKAGENWPLYFADYGYILIAGAVMLAAGTVLCLCRCSRIAVLISSAGTVTAIVIMQLIANYADEAGFFSDIRNMPASAVYQQAILPTVIVTVLLIALSLMQFFSMDEVEKRKRRKQAENAEAPRIV